MLHAGRKMRQMAERPKTWDEWHRFARERLELDEEEAREYATLRSVEDKNRETLRRDTAA